jgi:hypothetical protein
MQELAVSIKHKQVWIPRNPWVVTQEICIVILFAHVDLHDQKAVLKLPANSLIGVNELVQDLAPASPMPADFEDDSFVVGLGLLDRFAKVIAGIASRVVIINAVERVGRCEGCRHRAFRCHISRRRYINRCHVGVSSAAHGRSGNQR